MAQKRMIDKKISVSEQVANLPIPAQLLFTWAIPHSDDIGLLPCSERTLKALVLPMIDMPLIEFSQLIAKIVEQGLWQVYEHNGEKFYRIVKFREHQTLKKDRQPQTILNIALSEKPKDSWKTLEDLGFHMEDGGFQLDSEVKGSEVKTGEGKGEGLTPRAKTEMFFLSVNNRAPAFQSFCKQLAEQNKADINAIAREVVKFCAYWTEPNHTGTKLRWQQQKTFDVRRRLATWFSNVKGFSSFTVEKKKGREIIS